MNVPVIATALCLWALPAAGEDALDNWFDQITTQLESRSLTEIQSAKDWERHREKYRRQLSEMLGLTPLPNRNDLNTTVVGTLEHEEFTVELLHFQPFPKLYVSANLYIPRQRKDKLPGILYVCGHGSVIEEGQSYGNKTHYHKHGVWFARNGYVCLIVDTVQWGEFSGKHHGTYRHKLWWWANRGYTPAGTEAWTGIRAIDLLQSRPEVDADRIGVTGRSGGGAYTWWIAALDERVKCAVPVAGITSMRNHIIDGCIEGHCDCMYMVNYYGWDFAQVAALIAPRPLLISNTDKDPIFPLDGVIDVHKKTHRIYDLLGSEERLGLHISEGGHVDTQEVRINAFRWLNRWLKNDSDAITIPAEEIFERHQLRVFKQLPTDEITTTIHEHLVPQSDIGMMQEFDKWGSTATRKLKPYIEQSGPPSPLFLDIRLFHKNSGTYSIIPLHDLDTIKALPELTHVRRRHQLLGRSLNAEHAIALQREITRNSGTESIRITATGETGKTALIMAHFTPSIKEVVLEQLPASFAGPKPNDQEAVFLGINRHLTLSQLVALVARERIVRVRNSPDFNAIQVKSALKAAGVPHQLFVD